MKYNLTVCVFLVFGIFFAYSAEHPAYAQDTIPATVEPVPAGGETDSSGALYAKIEELSLENKKLMEKLDTIARQNDRMSEMLTVVERKVRAMENKLSR